MNLSHKVVLKYFKWRENFANLSNLIAFLLKLRNHKVRSANIENAQIATNLYIAKIAELKQRAKAQNYFIFRTTNRVVCNVANLPYFAQ